MRSQRRDAVGVGAPLDDPRPKAPNPIRTAVIAVAVVVAIVAWMRYDPVESVESAFPCPPEATEVPAAGFDDGDAAQYPDRNGLCLLRNVETNQATIATGVRNDGWIGVRLTGVRLSGVPDVFSIDELAMAPSQAPLDAEQAVPIDGGTRLPANRTRVLTITISLPDCNEVNRARVATLDELPLRARVLGLPRDVDLRLDPLVRMQAEFCPP